MSEKMTGGRWVFAYGSVYALAEGEEYPKDENANRIALMDRNNAKTTPCERDANGRAIAALPECLEALRGLVTVLDESSLWEVQQARAALAKAGVGGAE